MKNSRRALFHSIISLVLCFSMLIGTTYAWFTDTESSMNNIIQSGNLDIEMYWNKDLSSNWTEVEEDKAIFDYDKWEPGYTEVRYVKIVNEGNLAFKYMMNLYALGAVGKLADVIDVYYVENPTAPISGREALSALTPVGVLSDVIKGLLPTAGTMEKDDEIIIAIALKMRESAGNEYMKESVGDSFTVQLIAAQLASENDAFGKDYDTDATFPEKPVNEGVTAPVENENGQAKNDVELNGTNASAKVPAGTKLEDGAKNLTLTVTDLPGTDEKVVVGEGETAKSFDVHIDGVASDNDKPIPVDLGEVAPKGMNGGNLKLTHMENGQPNAMTFVEREADLSNHNEFYYDPATGRVVVYLATFSEVAMVADNNNAWNGTVATAFAGGTGAETDPYIIANADQLVYFGDLISDENDTYVSAYYKLVADINLGGEENANKGILFYPIGYHKVGNPIATVDLDDAPEFVYQEEDPDYAHSRVSLLSEGDTTIWYTYGGAFKGTFDGNGHKISNIYQNTWQLKGNYSGNYWNAAMGLFGYVYGGTVKNLTVDKFSSDGEFTPTGVIAAYAANSTFENIAITNCNPRVYNTGNGGIVGIGGNTSDPDTYKLTFTNITIDNTNKISALWGSWDVACGGLVGMFRGAGHVYMTNCHVAAQIDVYNDVCGNYQYYWYRYSGMMVGTNKNMTTDANGYTVPETDKFHAENCTVHFGNWNDYYYCELVANSLASYTHDHQFSRLTEVKAVNGTTITPLEEDEEAFTVPSSGRYNYVVVNGEAATENATCYHFVNGETWTHDKAGTETVNGGTVLKEDKQHYYLPFNQLFTGYGWGVKHIPVYNGEDYAFEGITILDREVADSVVKFESVAEESYTTESTVEIGDLFKAASIDDVKLSIKGDKVQVTISPVGENSTAGAVYSANTTDWTQGTLKFSGIGAATITITDYYFCTPTTINVTIKDFDSVDKFEATNVKQFYHSIEGDSVVKKLGDIFTAVDGVEINSNDVEVTVTAEGATCEYTKDSDDWKNSILEFGNIGTVTLTITDKNYCNEAIAQVQISNPEETDKFNIKFPNIKKYLYRVGNGNDIKLSSLFEAEQLTGATVDVTFEKIAGNVEGTYTTNTSSWENGTIKFTGTGVVKITIDSNAFTIAKELNVEVVDAVNATTATSATKNNVVLLNDISSGFTVSGRYTVYGNGFTLNYTGNGQYLNNGLKQGVVTVSENGTLDNLRIVASIYPNAYLYYGSTSLGDYVQGGPSSVEGDRTRYHYQLSAVVAKGNATISNCYIYGGRTNVFVDTGDVTIKDTILECGTVANVQIQSNSSHTITFEDVTTIQYQVNPTIDDTSKVMLGAGIMVGPETNDNPTIVLNGDFKQYNWVTADDKSAASDSVAQNIIDAALGATAYNHTVNGKTASNLGIIYMNNYEAKVTNNTGLPYKLDTISMSGINGQVYSLQGATESQIYSDYASADKTTENGLYVPQFKYDSTLGGQYVAEGGDEHCYREGDTIKVMFPSGNSKEIDLAGLVDIAKYSGQNLNLIITCKDSSGNAVTVTEGKITLSAADTYTVTYTVTDTLFYDKDGKTVDGSKEYSWNVSVDVSLKDTAVPDAYYEFDTSKQKMGYYKKSGIAGTSIYQYIPFLAGLKIHDYNGQDSYLRFDGDNDFNKVASITVTNKYSGNDALVVVKLTDGGTITLQLLARADSGGGSTYTGSIKTSNNVIYFVNDGTTSDKESTTTAAYWYVDYYKFTGNNGVEITSAQQKFNSTGSSASTPSGSFSTTIKYTVTYDANGGNCGQTTGYATSASAAVTLPTPTRSGYIFAGWYTAASGGTRVGGAGESYTPSANITLYAQWGKPCTVTYNANGGSCGTASEKYTGAALILPTPTRDGYWFIGWYDAAEGGNKIGDADAKYNPTGEMTLYAHWQEAIKYIVTYDANGGSCGTASATYQGTALTLPTPARTGYTFSGWYTAASGGTKIGDADASYTPSANITLYAQWKINSYTIQVTTNNATVKVNGTTVNNNGTVSIQYDSQVTVEVTYSESDDRSTTIKGADGTTYTSPFTMPAQAVTINATSSSCITPDTLITLADGSQVRVDSLTGGEELLVWNMETGMLDSAPIMFVDSDPEAEFEVVHLYFSDGTDVKVIYEHGFWDYDLNKYVYLDASASEYIGHTFAKQNGETLDKVQLVDVVIEREVTTAWSPVTVGHLCYFVNGMLSMPGGVGGLFNIFEVDAETMTYDPEAMAEDIEAYGLFTYEELNAIAPLSEAMFEAAGGAYLKISIGKGNLTIDELVAMINRYSVYFD